MNALIARRLFHGSRHVWVQAWGLTFQAFGALDPTAVVPGPPKYPKSWPMYPSCWDKVQDFGYFGGPGTSAQKVPKPGYGDQPPKAEL